MAVAMRIAAKFNSYYADRPGENAIDSVGDLPREVTNESAHAVLTTMVTNAVLGGVADTVAQLITAVKARSAIRHSPDGDMISIEIHEIDKERPPPLGELGHAKHIPPPFDFERLTRFMSYGFFMAPIQFKWFGFLSRAFPLTKKNPTLPALKRVAADQLIFAPFGMDIDFPERSTRGVSVIAANAVIDLGLACFFTFMTVAEGGGKRALTRKFQDVYLPTLKANFVLWPAVQILNFRVVPIQFQIPFVSTVGIAWTAYLSLTNSAEEE
ncbi:Mpv17/PMP22 family protein [Aspergillus clavatus NRRL 1]|uniref:Integral membrane protein, Mpv17/PMP22 family, putative n=1 Tax=Aspergillus clavatus (strain ATCC 1007 / CBS 513.65 / DSM 816 / NCTC 3887 / NRRL 1 / QM 1276 / 107) TaxID=344612 RepID=A1CQ83_ASPCL|nr:integral membrane protein, Mpv17/PMP22 family, putative [Aspergillus clavatus NRRL 1]EAW07804.1 integral membrane protein, Mpv17/PMP22 family, putative [Aspergillus clavatus NRRL 1]